MYIVTPTRGEEAYRIAAAEFQSLYEKVTGIRLEIVEECPDHHDAVIIGSDIANEFSKQAFFTGILPSFRIRYGTDDYSLQSIQSDNRTLLFLAGGRGRSTLYAVYDFFERRAGCGYFWDGDVIPHRETIDITGLDVVETPRFQYRGLRYFAHRGLHRYQAEMWGLKDWKKEIDWICKKRLNLFMLRIGMDDLFQKAFPEFVGYPNPDEELSDNMNGFNNRGLFWPLEYRGQLRKQILEYAFARDLMHPEDTGTMTHWYSRTPRPFLDSVKPAFLNQSNSLYAEETGSVWDIRKEENLELYFKLTQTHIKEYGKPDLFHTIGLAERMFSENRDENMKLKSYTYRKIAQYLKMNYPTSRLLLASWDLTYRWEGDEVKRLLEEIDPEHAMIFDYTSDFNPEENDWELTNTFENWDVIGKFPWIFGIFHAYEPQSDIRGDYAFINQKLSLAANDPMCKGMVFWPELSHSDTLMLEYFTENSWNPLTKSSEDLLAEMSIKRYGSHADAMLKVWLAFYPLIKLKNKAMGRQDQPPIGPYHEYFYDILNTDDFYAGHLFNVTEDVKRYWDYMLGQYKAHKSEYEALFQLLESLPEPLFKNDKVKRDLIDITRTVMVQLQFCHLMHLGQLYAQWLERQDSGEYVLDKGRRCLKMLELFGRLLGMHNDYSMNESLQSIRREHQMNDKFESVLKDNMSAPYCRQSAYEMTTGLYIPEMQVYLQHLESRIKSLPLADIEAEKKRIFDTFMDMPLSEITLDSELNWTELVNEFALLSSDF